MWDHNLTKRIGRGQLELYYIKLMNYVVYVCFVYVTTCVIYMVECLCYDMLLYVIQV